MKIKCLNEDARAPTRGSEHSAGYDLYSSEQLVIAPNDQQLISTGISMEIPIGHFGKIFDRSGFTLTNHTRVAAGVIDADYRGEVKILIQNLGKNPITIEKHSRIAQMVIMPCYSEPIEIVEQLNESERGAAGFGSTGTN